MGKSARARKAKKADFSKVKMKVGKKLKKAQNETRTDFKTRKIIVQEQLAMKSDDALATTKKHNIKELMARLQNTNVYVRQDGINGLLELVRKKECEVLVPHLSIIVGGSAPCIFDSDARIRTTTIKFLEALIMKVGVHLEPYLSVVATHLSCAMVHLNMHVQGDSLKLMNVLVTHCPALIARYSSTLLTNFINLISRKANSIASVRTGPPDRAVNFSRLLQDSPSNKMTSHRWRVRLLRELSAFMGAVLAEQDRVEHHLPLTTWQTVASGSIRPILTDSGPRESSGQQVSLFSNPSQLESFVNTIMPLLFQIWAEVEPSSGMQSNGSNLLTEEGKETLSCIISIITQLWQTTQALTEHTPSQGTWFVHQLKPKYLSKIMRWFPYYSMSAPTQKKRKRGGSEDEDYGLRHCDDLNMSLAAFALQLSPSHQKLHHNVSNFIAKLLLDGNRDGQYYLASVVDAVVVLLTPALGHSYAASPKAVSSLSAISLLAATHTCYSRLHPLKKDRPLLLHILLAATNLDNKHLWECEIVGAWVEDLVRELREGEVREGVIEAAITLCLRGNTALTSLVTSTKTQIREHIRSKGVKGWSEDKINLKLKFLLKTDS